MSRGGQVKAVVIGEMTGYIVVPAVVLLVIRFAAERDTSDAWVGAVAVTWVYVLANLVVPTLLRVVREEQIIVLMAYPAMQASSDLNFSDALTTASDLTAVIGAAVFVICVGLLSMKKKNLDEIYLGLTAGSKDVHTAQMYALEVRRILSFLVSLTVALCVAVSVIYCVSTDCLASSLNSLDWMVLLLGPVAAIVSIALSYTRWGLIKRRKTTAIVALLCLLPFLANFLMFLVFPLLAFDIVHDGGGTARLIIPLYSALFVGTYYSAALIAVARSDRYSLVAVRQYYLVGFGQPPIVL